MPNKIFNFDPTTHIYLGTSMADESPLEPGVYLVPGNATQIAPPTVGIDQVAVFTDDAWAVLTDRRGDWYNAERQLVTITTLDADVTGLTRTCPPDALVDLVDDAWVFSVQRAIDQTRASARQIRLPIIGILDGMQASALTAGDLPLAKSIEVAKVGLKDITKVDLSACKTADEMQIVILLAYQSIALTLPVAARTAFAQVLA